MEGINHSMQDIWPNLFVVVSWLFFLFPSFGILSEANFVSIWFSFNVLFWRVECSSSFSLFFYMETLTQFFKKTLTLLSQFISWQLYSLFSQKSLIPFYHPRGILSLPNLSFSRSYIYIYISFLNKIQFKFNCLTLNFLK
jgi:hypothetical protein